MTTKLKTLLFKFIPEVQGKLQLTRSFEAEPDVIFLTPIYCSLILFIILSLLAIIRKVTPKNFRLFVTFWTFHSYIPPLSEVAKLRLSILIGQAVLITSDFIWTELGEKINQLFAQLLPIGGGEGGSLCLLKTF